MINTSKILGWDIESFSWPDDKCPYCGYVGEMIETSDRRSKCPECRVETEPFESLGQPWEDFAPIGISCAGASFNAKKYRGWHSGKADAPMTKDECLVMLDNLETAVDAGWFIAAVNGSGFDFKCLAYETGEWERCARLMWGSIDLMFVSVAVKGWRLGLDAIAKGSGLHGKLKSVTLTDGTVLNGMSGKLAPQMWRQGEMDAVLAYLKEDCDMTSGATRLVLNNHKIEWVSNSGKLQFMSVPYNATVRDCMGLRVPNNSWMSNPVKREDIVGWAMEWL